MYSSRKYPYLTAEGSGISWGWGLKKKKQEMYKD